jgi:hypothetical protein
VVVRERFGYVEQVATPTVTILKRYKRLRAVELALLDALDPMVTDAAVDAAASSIGLSERGEALYEHEDFSTLLELATYHHRVRGKTAIERFFEESKPAVGTDEHLVLAAMVKSRSTLLQLGRPVDGVGVHVDDLLFGGEFLLADVQLSRYRKSQTKNKETIIATRLLAFDDFAMTPGTSYLGFDPELAQMMASGTRNESVVPMAERYASAEARVELANELVEMALCSVVSVRAGLLDRFPEASTTRP